MAKPAVTTVSAKTQPGELPAAVSTARTAPVLAAAPGAAGAGVIPCWKRNISRSGRSGLTRRVRNERRPSSRAVAAKTEPDFAGGSRSDGTARLFPCCKRAGKPGQGRSGYGIAVPRALRPGRRRYRRSPGHGLAGPGPGCRLAGPAGAHIAPFLLGLLRYRGPRRGDGLLRGVRQALRGRKTEPRGRHHRHRRGGEGHGRAHSSAFPSTRLLSPPRRSIRTSPTPT